MPLSVRDEFATLFQTLLVEIGVFLSRQQARKKKRKEKKPKLERKKGIMVESEPVPISNQSKIKYTPIPELGDFLPCFRVIKAKTIPC